MGSFLIFCLSATIGLALGFKGSSLPCDLCLIERFPYYGALSFLLLAGFRAWFFRIIKALKTISRKEKLSAVTFRFSFDKSDQYLGVKDHGKL